MSEVPKNVHYDPYNLCYRGNCPYCKEPISFYKYGEYYIRNTTCSKCGKTVNVRPWMEIK